MLLELFLFLFQLGKPNYNILTQLQKILGHDTCNNNIPSEILLSVVREDKVYADLTATSWRQRGCFQKNLGSSASNPSKRRRKTMKKAQQLIYTFSLFLGSKITFSPYMWRVTQMFSNNQIEALSRQSKDIKKSYTNN